MLISSTYAGVAPTTSQRMELTAALEGLKSIARTFISSDDGVIDEKLIPIRDEIKEIEIMSDSAYLVNAMVQMWHVNWIFNNWISLVDYQPIKNRDLWEPILFYKDFIETAGYSLRFRKVKGHAGLIYNEVADQLAVKGKMLVS
jgi:ribonuclease HI